LIIVSTVTLASSNNALPDDGDYTETCRICFSINFNIPFKAIPLCIRWQIKNFDNVVSVELVLYNYILQCFSLLREFLTYSYVYLTILSQFALYISAEIVQNYCVKYSNFCKLWFYERTFFTEIFFYPISLPGNRWGTEIQIFMFSYDSSLCRRKLNYSVFQEHGLDTFEGCQIFSLFQNCGCWTLSAFSNHNVQQPFTYANPDAACAVLSAWWWAVCSPKHVELYINME